MIRISKLNFRYLAEAERVLCGCSADFTSPGHFLITGRNASGKSTLMDILSGFKVPESGRLLINNVEMYSSFKATRFLRSIISYMPSTLRLPDNLVLDYILRIWKGSYLTSELIELLGLSYYMEHKYKELSDGYKQRLHLAIAISRGSFIFLDEPLKSQDEELTRVFPELLESFAKGRTVIVTSPHYIDYKGWRSKFKLQGGELSQYV